jgi:lysine/ornithine N-monooxygenase
VSKVDIAIIGAGPYGLSLAAHLRAQNLEHRIFGHPMRFWSDVAAAAGERYLKSFCFATNLSAPAPGYTFPDYNGPRNLETVEPCSIANFTQYGQWFQQKIVPWVESVDALNVLHQTNGFAVSLKNGERLSARHVVVATGLSGFESIPRSLTSLPQNLISHTSQVKSFDMFKGRRVAVVGAGQSALEAAALLSEAGGFPELLVREDRVRWNDRTDFNRNLWERLRRPISGLGVGPKAWALFNFPGALRTLPNGWRASLLKNHLPPEGAWWLRQRVENCLPISLNTAIEAAREVKGEIVLQLCNSSGEQKRELRVDHVIAGSGYDIDVDRFVFLSRELRDQVARTAKFPTLDGAFQSSVPGLYFLGPSSTQSFGPLFRFVVGADYSARTVAKHLAFRLSAATLSPAKFRSAA